MVFIGTGVSATGNGKIEKSFCPTENAATLEFKWKFYSEEFKEWCGSLYQDGLKVSIQSGDEVVEVLDAGVDDLCPPEDCNTCGANYTGLSQADVEFDQGGVWMTSWQEVVFELPEGFAGEPVTLTVLAQDAGDSIFNSAVCVDAIAFVD